MQVLLKGKYKIIIVLIVVLLGIIPLFGQQPFQKENLKEFNASIEIRLDKNRFLTREPIWVHITVINRNEIGPDISAYISECLIVKDERGNIYSPNMSISVDGYLPMKSGETREDQYDITDLYGKPDMEDPKLMHVFPSGRYTIQCEWREMNYMALLSNTLEFSVVEPEGKEVEALKILREVRKLFIEKKWELIDMKYSELLTKYPNSVYCPLVLWHKLNHNAYINPNREKLLKDCKMMLEQYPDSYYFDNSIRHIVKVYQLNNDPDGSITYFNNLMNITDSNNLKEKLREKIDMIQKGEIK